MAMCQVRPWLATPLLPVNLAARLHKAGVVLAQSPATPGKAGLAARLANLTPPPLATNTMPPVSLPLFARTAMQQHDNPTTPAKPRKSQCHHARGPATTATDLATRLAQPASPLCPKARRDATTPTSAAPSSAKAPAKPTPRQPSAIPADPTCAR
ncbi:hypothetical protein OsI_19600 [Oryza sativa Indica Group]|uniref:Uncharacterized protein n=1 Tax=Oryza sativa subsp. indica TaxID=39946 RepID=B8AX30_ORYSI|nr:hypothetical protein OsI_19600 [Oryza sativa Indica Group]